MFLGTRKWLPCQWFTICIHFIRSYCKDVFKFFFFFFTVTMLISSLFQMIQCDWESNNPCMRAGVLIEVLTWESKITSGGVEKRGHLSSSHQPLVWSVSSVIFKTIKLQVTQGIRELFDRRSHALLYLFNPPALRQHIFHPNSRGHCWYSMNLYSVIDQPSAFRANYLACVSKRRMLLI